MPPHHFTTPRVTYLGSAHGAKAPREARAGARVRTSAIRPDRGNTTRRRTAVNSPAASR
jgi:hypothetical protein